MLVNWQVLLSTNVKTEKLININKRTVAPKAERNYLIACGDFFNDPTMNVATEKLSTLSLIECYGQTSEKPC